MLDMLVRCGAKDKTDFVFFNTGLEYQAKLKGKVDSVLNERNVEEFISNAASIARNTPEDYRADKCLL